MRGQATIQQEHTKLFQPAGSPYNQQHQLHHQTQYQQLRRDLLTHERFRSQSDESEGESTEFRPMTSQSTEMSASSANVETVVPPPPNQHKRSPFHINVPSDEQSNESGDSSGPSRNNQFTHNIEIPVHFYRLSPLASGEGFAISQ